MSFPDCSSVTVIRFKEPETTITVKTVAMVGTS